MASCFSFEWSKLLVQSTVSRIERWDRLLTNSLVLRGWFASVKQLPNHCQHWFSQRIYPTRFMSCVSTDTCFPYNASWRSQQRKQHFFIWMLLSPYITTSRFRTLKKYNLLDWPKWEKESRNPPDVGSDVWCQRSRWKNVAWRRIGIEMLAKMTASMVGKCTRENDQE